MTFCGKPALSTQNLAEAVPIKSFLIAGGSRQGTCFERKRASSALLKKTPWGVERRIQSRPSVPTEPDFCVRGLSLPCLVSILMDAVVLWPLRAAADGENSTGTYSIYFFSAEGSLICAQISPNNSHRKIYCRPRQRTKQPLTRSAARIAPQDAIRTDSRRRFSSSWQV